MIYNKIQFANYIIEHQLRLLIIWFRFFLLLVEFHNLLIYYWNQKLYLLILFNAPELTWTYSEQLF